MHILSLSTEILEYISACVDKPGDLHALALTCREFAQIIIPNHLEHSYIRADPRRQCVWGHLYEKAHLAARVRTLEIIEETKNITSYPVIPRLQNTFGEEFQDPALQKPAFLLHRAIMKMPKLKTFRWLSLAPFEVTVGLVALACQELSSLEVICMSPNDERWLAHTLCRFSNLKQFAYSGGRVKWDVPNADIYQRRLTTFHQLLQRKCPDLEDLQLDCMEDIGSNPLPGLIAPGVCPNLTRLNLQASILYVGNHQGAKIVHIPSFPNLETLCLVRVEGYTITFSPLPMLRSLEMDDINQRIPFPIAQNLTSLSLIINPPSINRDLHDLSMQLAPILRNCINLRILVVKSVVWFEDAFSCLLKACPTKLEKLAYDGPPFFVDTNKLATVKAQMSNLTHLGLVNAKDCKSSSLHNDVAYLVDNWIVGSLGPVNVKRFLVASAPRLKFLGLRNGDKAPFWERIERDESGSFRGFRKLDKRSYQDDIVYENWEDHYRGTYRFRVRAI